MSFFLLAFGGVCVCAQQAAPDYRSGAVKTNCGYMLVWNKTGNYFTLDITGKDVKQISTDLIQFNVDGAFLQVVTVNLKDFLKGDKKPDNRGILSAHRDWESAYLEEEYKSKLTVQSSWQTLPNGDEALYWQFDVPAVGKGNVKKQNYLALVRGEYVLLLGSIVTDTITEKASRNLLLLTALTLRPSDKPTDLARLQDIFKGN